MKKIVVCNHKMLLTYDEASNYEKKLEDIDLSNIKLIICPSYINLNLFNKFNLGAQDVFYEDKGSYTGEISAYFLSLVGVRYSIIGHFERRKYDSNEIINKKIKSALKNSITPIVCIGESKTDKELMRTSYVIKKQIKEYFDGIKLGRDDELIIAYEPGWAIGNGKSLYKDEILDTFKFIRKTLEMYGIDKYKLLYGGSVCSKTIKNILSDDIDGYLVGASSADASELEKIIKSIK